MDGAPVIKGPGLYEFLVEAELQHYYNSIKSDLKVQIASQLKCVTVEDLAQLGMSKPERRRLKKFYNKHFPQNYIRKFERLLSVKKDDALLHGSGNINIGLSEHVGLDGAYFGDRKRKRAVTGKDDRVSKQVQAKVSNTDASHLLPSRIGDIITVFDKSSHDHLWKGVLPNGKTGLFNPAHVFAYIGNNLPSGTLRPESFIRDDIKTSSRRKLNPSMISGPQRDLKHTGHVGLDGAYFGDRKRKRAVTNKDDRVSKRPRNEDSEFPSDLQDESRQDLSDELHNGCQTKQYIPHRLIGLMYRLDLSVFYLLRKSMYEHKYPSLSLAFEDSEIDKFSNIVLRYEEKSIHKTFSGRNERSIFR